MFGSSSNQYACQVCLDTATPGESVKFHRHHSSFFYKKWHLEQGLKELKCPTCKIVHPIEPDVERKVVFMTSSTLHNVFLDPAVRLPFHLDIESICGARLTDMIRAWRRTYGRAEVACDTIVLAGLNDVPYCTADSFASGLMAWKHDVIEAHPWNTLRVCRLPRPPRLAWFSGDGPEPDNYTNYLNRINEINQRIDEFNFTEGEETIGFQLSGCRGGQRGISHVWCQWREIEQGKKHCLHLSDKKRVDMFRTLARHIMTKILNPDRLKVFKNVRAELAEINVNV